MVSCECRMRKFVKFTETTNKKKNKLIYRIIREIHKTFANDLSKTIMTIAIDFDWRERKISNVITSTFAHIIYLYVLRSRR